MPAITAPYPQFFDLDGNPLESGYIYVGTTGGNPETAPVAAYWDAARTIPAAQPLRTLHGYIVRSGTPAQVYVAGDFSLMVKTAQKVLVAYQPVASDYNGILSVYNDLASSAVGKGSKLVAFIQRMTGAVATWVEDKLAERISLNDFLTDAQRADIKAGTLAIDCTAAVNAWCLALRTASLGTLVTSYDTIQLRGALGRVPQGKIRLDGKVTFYENTGWKGAGRFSSIFVTSYNGNAFEMAAPVGYDGFGCIFEGFSIVGDRTKASQVGIASMRLWESEFKNVGVYNCGSEGWLFRQCLNVHLDNCEALLNVGYGLRGMDGAVSWTDSTPNNLPSNNCTISRSHFANNDKAGVLLSQVGSGTGCNGWYIGTGTSIEKNYYSSAAGTGYNIEVTSASYFPNEIEGVWCEGTVKSHVYINTPATTVTSITRLQHFAEGSGSYPERAVIVNNGALWLDEPFGNGNQYKTVAASNAPFRVNRAGGGTIRVTNAYGSGVTNNKFVEDQTGATTGLDDICRQTNFGEQYGFSTHTTTAGVNGPSYYKEGETFPFAEFSNFNRGLGFGGGAGAVDVYLVRKAADIMGPAAGDNFQVGGIAGETLKFNVGAGTGAVATTFSGNAPTGATAGNPLGWLRINVGGTDRFVPYW